MFDNKYAESYQINSKKLFNKDNFELEIINLISENVNKNNYKGLDIGSNDDSFGESLNLHLKNYKKFDKGIIINIDPLINHENVIKKDGEEYIKETNELFDFIICKFSIHFMKNIDLFINNCLNKLNKNGIFWIFAGSPFSIFPWTQRIQDKWIESCFITDLAIYKTIDIFENKNVQEWIDLIKAKSYSHLYLTSDEELNECIEYLKNQNQTILKSQLIINIYKLEN
jgi:SAM-dependent methyltransferase